MNYKQNSKKLNNLIQELETYSNYKRLIKKEVDEIKALYVKGKINADKRDKLIFQHLKGKTIQQVLKQYDAYLDSIKGQIKYAISEIFYLVYNDKSVPPVKIKKESPNIDKVSKTPNKKDKKIIGDIARVEKEEQAIEKEIKAKKEVDEVIKKAGEIKPKDKKEAAKALKTQRKLDPKKPILLKPEKTEEPEFLKDESIEAEQIDSKPPEAEAVYLGEKTKDNLETKEDRSFLVKNRSQEKFKATKKKKAKKSKNFEMEVPDFIEKKLDARSFLGDKTEIPSNLVEMETLHKRAEEAKIEMTMSPEVLKEEAERVRKVMEEKKPEQVYKPSKLGAIANLFVRGLGRKIVGKWPELFEQLYSVLRPANIRTLSNTYVNIIIFLSIIATALSGVFFFFLFLFTTYSFGELFIKTFLMALFMGIVTMIVVYAYPFMKVAERKKNIEVNMPFAINHMSAIASAGLSPAKLFELVAQSEEYGELTLELKKVVEYIKLFGYDLKTALNDVSNNTPSDKFKDFLEGMNASLQSGGNIEEYLKAKTDEAIEDYRLVQQKHIETISTYSDIYTGILIAAPLFFISILSLVSILGGTIAGFPVQTIIAAGTYLAIPLLNIAFLLFLQIGQQEV